MNKPLTRPESVQPLARPFPWFCSRCRRQEVRRTRIPYQCQRLYKGQPLTIVIPDLAVPQCGHCGELEFDYVAEEQINQAYKTQTDSLAAIDQVHSPLPAELRERE